MSAPGPRFCPRCGTERVGDMRFCPNCGLDLAQLGSDDRPIVETVGPAVAPAVAPADSPVIAPTAMDRGAIRRSAWRPLLGPGLLVLLLIAAAWFVGIGPF